MRSADALVSVPRRPHLTGAELVRTPQRLGRAVVVQRGSQYNSGIPDRGGRVTVPVEAGKVLGPGLTRAVLRQGGVSADEVREVL